ncbi:hypothetical protein AA12717_0305 [Gluconacetobacter sacchari DSM 12717]|uniref:Uncharacterized protein n=1 Tax=Gluconacetobacter sacchari DSM 12717 TaxID=1307940 RepID=A0ABQ0P2K0_9PROT|nr:hypothetical protein AA12717_0305 [Gluconacetobacter sacchari DSM 12717]
MSTRQHRKELLRSQIKSREVWGKDCRYTYVRNADFDPVDHLDMTSLKNHYFYVWKQFGEASEGIGHNTVNRAWYTRHP